MAKKVVLAGACRTAIGKMGGALSNTPAADLGAIVIKEALRRAGVKPEMVDEVKMGCVIQAAQGQNVARQASIKAGLPIEVPAITINVVCGSGLKCVNDAATMIMAGEADIVVAGGMENMSMAPYAMTKARFGYRMNNATIIDTMVNDALTDAFNHYHMMITAENVCDKYGITREELDEFSANSQQKCEAAIAAGKFKDEIVPVEVKSKKKTIVFDTDEGPRPGTTAESLSGLRCCSGKEGGVVTAGNASGINDGAAAIVVMSEEKAKELGVTPMATFVAGALGGVDPKIMGIGPVASTKKVLAKTGLTIDVSANSVDCLLTERFGSTKEGRWLAKNAHKYGYIIRYPKGKTKLTGYSYEPWHIRYVGVSYASYLKKNKLTLEELYGVNQKADENTPKVDVENPDEYETSPSSPAPNQ